MMAVCRGCGSVLPWGDDGTHPASDGCVNCPAETCATCGLLDGGTKRCACWVAVEDLALPDLKALFARDGLSVTPAQTRQGNS